MTQYMDLGEIPLLATIEADTELATCDMKGENVFYLPETATVVEGTRKALKKIEIM